MEERKKEIIERTLDLFSKRGIKSLNMGDISSLQHISKKTLYNYFKDKNDLVCSCMSFELERTSKEIDLIMQKGLNAIDVSYEISRFVINQLTNMNPTLFIELEAFHPEALMLFEDHQQNCIGKTVYENIEKGMEEKLYRADLNIEIVTSIYMTLMYNLISARLVNNKNFSFSEIYMEFFKYHIHGISSEKGQEFLKIKFEK
jgi:AcrR family transcriptional regulator